MGKVGKPVYQKSFIKWAGSKRNALPYLLPLLPRGRRLVEPFVGAGNVARNTDYKSYLLADANPALISTYQHLRRYGGDFISACQAYFDGGNERETFDLRKDQFNNGVSDGVKAALFVYLNRHCFNGLWRVNSKGEFNVSFGKYNQPYFPGDELLDFYKWIAGRNVEIACQDFRQTMSVCGGGDVVYCDPPFVPVVDSNFSGTTSGVFDQFDQADLVHEIFAAVERGATAVLSNHDTEYTRDLYSTATEIHSFPVRRSISCDGDKRAAAQELVAIYRPGGRGK